MPGAEKISNRMWLFVQENFWQLISWFVKWNDRKWYNLGMHAADYNIDSWQSHKSLYNSLLE